MFIPPMLLQYAINNEPIDDSSTFTELKWDGIRLIVSNMDELNLYTKNTNATSKYPELLNPPIQKGTILDGEVVVLDEHGKADFEACNARFKSSKVKHKVVYFAFDILYHRGVDVTGLPLEVRKVILEEAVTENDHYRIVRPINGSATDFFNIVCQHGLEGIVIKKKNSKYEKDTRSWSWQKVINYQRTEVYITGYSKKEHSWLLGYSDDGRIRPIGALELGITQSARQSMWPVFQAYKCGESKDHVYVQPLVRCKVKYRDWYKSGAMRLPVFEEFIV